MWKRRRFVIGGVALSVVALAGGALLVCNRDRITLRNYNRLRRGMTAEEVVGILGPPTKAWTYKGLVLGPDHYRLGGYGTSEHRNDYQDFTLRRWEAERVHIVVEFNPEGRTFHLSCIEDKLNPLWYEPTIQRFRQWIGF